MRSVITLHLGLLVLSAAATTAFAGDARIAVAANFTQTAKRIGTLFAKASGHQPIFSFGSTGQLYTQISQGAPFDVFLSADQPRAKKTIEAGFAVPDSRFSYAIGRLALFSRNGQFVQGSETLSRGDFSKIALANPITAPYGAAAVETMKALKVYSGLQTKLVQGNNIAQTYQFVFTGNAELGFVALSQIAGHEKGSRWVVPEKLHLPLRQDAVLLKRGAKNAAAIAFLSFLKRQAAHAVIKKHGYGVGE